MPADSLKTQGKVAAPRFFGFTLLEMVMAVSLLAGLSSFSFEWLAVENRLRQAELESHKLASLVTLIYRYAENPPNNTPAENQFLTHIHVDNEISSVNDGIPGNNLMDQRWPADLIALTAALEAMKANLPTGVQNLIKLPGAGLSVLGSSDFQFESQKALGFANLTLQDIPLEQKTIARQTAVLLRRQGFPTTYEEVDADPANNKPATVKLTMHLLPLEKVLSPYVVGTDRVADIDAEYKVDLVVGGLSTRDAMAHTAFIPYATAPFDFTMDEDDRAIQKALKYVQQGQQDTTKVDALKKGMRRLGGYSGFFNTCVKVWGATYHPRRYSASIKFDAADDNKRVESIRGYRSRGVQDCALHIERYSSNEIATDSNLWLMNYITRRYSMPGSSLYSWFNPMGIMLVKDQAVADEKWKTWKPEKRNAFDNSLGDMGFGRSSLVPNRYLGPALIEPDDADPWYWLSAPVVYGGRHAPRPEDAFQDLHFNEAASFAANTVIASANFPGIPSPRMGVSFQSYADKIDEDIFWRWRQKPDAYSPERMAWMRENAFVIPPTFSVSWRPFNFHTMWGTNSEWDNTVGPVTSPGDEPEDEQGQNSYCRINEMLNLDPTGGRQKTEDYAGKFLNVPELDQGKPLCKHSLWRAPRIAFLPENQRSSDTAITALTSMPAPVFGVVVRGTEDWHQKDSGRGIFFPNEFIHSPGLMPRRLAQGSGYMHYSNKLALHFERAIDVVQAGRPNLGIVPAQFDDDPSRQSVQIDEDDWNNYIGDPNADGPMKQIIDILSRNPTTLSPSGDTLAVLVNRYLSGSSVAEKDDPYRRIAAMLAIARQTTPASMLEETYNGTTNILQEARDNDLSHEWWHKTFDNEAGASDQDSVEGCSKSGTIRYIKNEFSLQCIRNVWKEYWKAQPTNSGDPTFDELPLHLKDFLRYVAFRIYGGAALPKAATKHTFDWTNTGSQHYKNAKDFFDGTGANYGNNPPDGPDWDAVSWINKDMSNYRSWGLNRGRSGGGSTFGWRPTCESNNPVMGTLYHWPDVGFPQGPGTQTAIRRRASIPFWYNDEADYDYPIGSSLCAGTLPGFPLTMHEGIYFLDGMHIYGKMYKRSDRRLKSNLRLLQAPEGGLSSPHPGLLERHYPDLLSAQGESVGVDADGMVVAMWQEVRTLVQQQKAELRTLEMEIDRLLCRRLPDRCPTIQESPR